MATYNEINKLSKNQHLLDRVSSALAKAADDIRNEVTDVASHAERFTWASNVLLVKDGPRNEAIRSIWLVLQNVDISDGYDTDPLNGGIVTDNDVQFVVNSIINFLAGV